MLGSCVSLVALDVLAPSLSHLDLRGCGTLRDLALDCPRLEILDATFCSELCDAELVAALARAPLLNKLLLGACSQVRRAVQLRMPTLRVLDLSYTDVVDLQPLFNGCPGLRALNVASCRSLTPAAFRPLVQPSGDGADNAVPPAPPGVLRVVLPQLEDLDLSYCSVEAAVISRLLQAVGNLRSLSLNGCDSVTDQVFDLPYLPAEAGAKSATTSAR